MKGHRTCSVYRCNSKQYKDIESKLKFYTFPVKNETRCSKWLAFASNPLLTDKTNSKLQNYCICSKHFSPKNFRANGFLLWNALPDINPPPLSSKNHDSIDNYNVLFSSLFDRNNNKKQNLELAESILNSDVKNLDKEIKLNDSLSLENSNEHRKSDLKTNFYQCLNEDSQNIISFPFEETVISVEISNPVSLENRLHY